MAVVVPLLVHKCSEALKRSVIWIEEDLSQRTKNWGTLVATRTVNQAVGTASHNSICNLVAKHENLFNLRQPIRVFCNLKQKATICLRIIKCVKSMHRFPSVLIRLANLIVIEAAPLLNYVAVDLRVLIAELVTLLLALDLLLARGEDAQNILGFHRPWVF